MKKLASLLKTTSLAAAGSLLLAALPAQADLASEPAAASPEAAATVPQPEKTAGSVEKDAKKEAKKDKKKKHKNKTGLEKKRPERASGSK